MTDEHDHYLKVCGKCGRKYDLDEWSRLEYVGVQSYGPKPVELRNCQCKTTLGVCLSDERIAALILQDRSDSSASC